MGLSAGAWFGIMFLCILVGAFVGATWVAVARAQEINGGGSAGSPVSPSSAGSPSAPSSAGSPGAPSSSPWDADQASYLKNNVIAVETDTGELRELVFRSANTSASDWETSRGKFKSYGDGMFELARLEKAKRDAS